jgi:hypothetical protein
MSEAFVTCEAVCIEHGGVPVTRRVLTPRSSGRVKDKVPSSGVGVRAAQLNR